MVMIVLSPSLQSFPPAEAIRSSNKFSFRKSTSFHNAHQCTSTSQKNICDPSLVHIAITLDVEYLRGSIAAVHSVLQHSLCPENIFFHFLVSDTNLEALVRDGFWLEKKYAGIFNGRKPCYFNTGVMVMDLSKWRKFGYTKKIERWMEIQKNERIYELGSLPPFLLVFAGHVAPIEHRWNQHGLGGDNVMGFGSCRDLHPGPVSLLHWSGSGKPWLRLDSNRPCPLDSLWAPYDLYGPIS
ncbi:hypothetical protein IFM89_005632 [Coptis chinensis]|uniref:Hexosyltransferase n=1 Tax=Coptis chinensis TaxID=261450 RepID=A0A835HR82_9MAGN|nr:hypothetical protein IFM89_005632 [Coptis chinensis]